MVSSANLKSKLKSIEGDYIIKKGKYIEIRPSGLIEARYDLTSNQNDI